MFPDKCFGFKFELVDEFTEIVPNTFGYFKGHRQELFESFKIALLKKRF